MRYECVHCDQPFEPEPQSQEEDADKPRCPKCLRVTGVRRRAEASGRSRPRWLWLAVAGGVLLAGGAGYAWMRQAEPPDPAELSGRPLAVDTVVQELQRRGIDARGYASLLAVDAAVERFASAALAGADGAEGKATAVVAAVQARKQALAYVRWPLADALPRAPHTAGEVAQALSEDEARKRLYPLEATALAVAALRAADVPALVAEVYAYAGERRPLDASGHLGYFAVALPAKGGGPARLYDAYGGRAPAAAGEVEHAVLSDLEAVGAALALDAVGAIARNEEPSKALAAVDAAIKLLPTSPSVRTARGAVLLASGGESAGSGEFEAAAQMRPDAPRRNNLALLLMAKGEGERATREVSLALESAPDFASAHVTLASVHLAQGDREQARQALTKAESLEPALPNLPLAWAQLHASAGEMAQAVARAQEGVRLRPENPQGRLLLARLYRQAGQYDEMRKEARAILAATPASQKTRIEGLIESLLGPTALEEPAGGPAGGEPGALAEPGQLELKEPTIGGGQGEPRLLDESLGDDPPGGLKLGGDAPRLKLREPGSKLQLDLDR